LNQIGSKRDSNPRPCSREAAALSLHHRGKFERGKIFKPSNSGEKISPEFPGFIQFPRDRIILFPNPDCHPTIIVTFAQMASNAYLHIRVTEKNFVNALIKK
jgi:hypothetical protein